MGAELFDEFPEEVALVDRQLGYSIRTLCVSDPDQRLAKTEFTQVAMFVTNALSYLKWRKQTGLIPDFVAGHSLGEYNALHAAEVFDLITGIEIVRKRGEIMQRASGGGMAAVVGFSYDRVRALLDKAGFDSIDIANINSPTQIVIAGPPEDLDEVKELFENAEADLFVRLPVGGAFHSRYMKQAETEFGAFLERFELSPPKIPVISNVTARPFEVDQLRQLMCRQMTCPVLWTEIVAYLLKFPDPIIEEVGPGNVLTKLVNSIRRAMSA